jgi:hypothetical protein
MTKKLYHALIIESENKVLNNDNIYNMKNVIFVCAELIMMNKENNIIHFVYYTI